MAATVIVGHPLGSRGKMHHPPPNAYFPLTGDSTVDSPSPPHTIEIPVGPSKRLALGPASIEMRSKTSKEWIHPFCQGDGDTPTCCLGFWCPCILYGKIQWRLWEKTLGRDPLDEDQYSSCNPSCWTMKGFTAFCCPCKYSTLPGHG